MDAGQRRSVQANEAVSNPEQKKKKIKKIKVTLSNAISLSNVPPLFRLTRTIKLLFSCNELVVITLKANNFFVCESSESDAGKHMQGRSKVETKIENETKKSVRRISLKNSCSIDAVTYTHSAFSTVG